MPFLTKTIEKSQMGIRPSRSNPFLRNLWSSRWMRLLGEGREHMRIADGKSSDLIIFASTEALIYSE